MHLQRTLASLAACPAARSTRIVAFCDGPKGVDDVRAVAEVRQVLRAATGFAQVRVVEREGNLGLAANVIDGVSQVLDDSPTAIVLEDDMIVSPDFLDYMNDALALYASDDRVVSIHGYVYPTREALPQTFFLRGADCWGWATWRRGWSVFDPDGAALLARIEATGVQREFDMDGSYPYTRMLRSQVAGEIDSWAIRWYASAFLADKLTLYPGASLVENIGLDGSGTHSTADAALMTRAGRMGVLERIPVVESPVARQSIARALRRSRSPWTRVRSLVRR